MGSVCFSVAHKQDSLQQKDIRQNQQKKNTHGRKPTENGAKSPGVPYLQNLCQTFKLSINALQQLLVSCLLPGMSSLFNLTNCDVNKSRSPQCQHPPPYLSAPWSQSCSSTYSWGGDKICTPEQFYQPFFDALIDIRFKRKIFLFARKVLVIT